MVKIFATVSSSVLWRNHPWNVRALLGSHFFEPRWRKQYWFPTFLLPGAAIIFCSPTLVFSLSVLTKQAARICLQLLTREPSQEQEPLGLGFLTCIYPKPGNPESLFYFFSLRHCESIHTDYWLIRMWDTHYGINPLRGSCGDIWYECFKFQSEWCATIPPELWFWKCCVARKIVCCGFIVVLAALVCKGICCKHCGPGW